jgi:hypothetical protein
MFSNESNSLTSNDDKNQHNALFFFFLINLILDCIGNCYQIETIITSMHIEILSTVIQ